ncbi:uncharacterized protein LOC105685374 [Athalia rosae]|uniref:uncharacterized protein LOC105685374 n=1 Tax=Athalia rosae TaxID=37344 RepID=UPI0020349B6D|nr:uncharacterized protein LOC105685374 [Athalia rosae]
MVRFKNRYVTIQVNDIDEPDKPLAIKSIGLHNAIQRKVLQLHGDFGVSAIKSGFNANYFNMHTRIALIKSRHGPHRFVVDAIRAVKIIDGRRVNLDILYIGATLKHCFNCIQKYQRHQLEKVWYTLRSDTERKNMENALTTMSEAMKNFK